MYRSMVIFCIKEKAMFPRGNYCRVLVPLMFIGTALAPTAVRADLFVSVNGSINQYTNNGALVKDALIPGSTFAISGSDIFVLNGNSIGEYALDGTPVNQSLITGLDQVPKGLAVSGSDVFVTNWGESWATVFNTGSVSEYNTSGDLINANLISNLDQPTNIAACGSNLFIGNFSGVSKFSTTGDAVPSARIDSPTDKVSAVAVSGSNVFVVNTGMDSVGEYTTSGAAVNPALLLGSIDQPDQIAVSGSNIFVSSMAYRLNSEGEWTEYGELGEYDTSGDVLNASLITLDAPFEIGSIAFAAPNAVTVPEPAMLGLAALATIACRRRRSCSRHI